MQRLAALVFLWIVSVLVPIRAVFALPLSVFFSGEVTSGTGFEGFEAFTTPGNVVYGSLSFDTATLSGSGYSYVPTPASTAGIHFASVSQDTGAGIMQFSMPGNPVYLDVRGEWEAISNPMHTPGITLAYVSATVGLAYPSPSTSTDFFVPAGLDGLTSASVRFYLHYLGPPVLIGTVTISQWAVVAAPEPGQLALFGAGLLLFALRRALAR